MWDARDTRIVTAGLKLVYNMYCDNIVDYTFTDGQLLNSCCITVDGPRFVSISPSGGRRITHGHVVTCTSDGNPRPAYIWTIALSDAANSITFTGNKLELDPCKLRSWSQISQNMNVSDTTELTVTCRAYNVIRGEPRTVSVQEIYDFKVFKNVDKLCGKIIMEFLENIC